MSIRLRSLADVPVVVTGASSGIGRSLALRLARQGARVALIARRQPKLAEVAEEIRAIGAESLIVPCDISDRQQVAEASQFVLAKWGGVDLLINNAGIGFRKPFLDADIEEFERTIDVNLLGAMYITKALLPSMVARRRGWLTFVASVAGRVSTPFETAYVASKAALIGFAESLSLEVEDAGVHVMTVCPGIVRTPFFGPEGPPAVDTRWSVQVEPDALADAIIGALAKGDRQLTFPRSIAASYLAQAVAPDWTRKQVKRASSRTPE